MLAPLQVEELGAMTQELVETDASLSRQNQVLTQLMANYEGLPVQPEEGEDEVGENAPEVRDAATLLLGMCPFASSLPASPLGLRSMPCHPSSLQVAPTDWKTLIAEGVSQLEAQAEGPENHEWIKNFKRAVWVGQRRSTRLSWNCLLRLPLCPESGQCVGTPDILSTVHSLCSWVPDPCVVSEHSSLIRAALHCELDMLCRT